MLSFFVTRVLSSNSGLFLSPQFVTRCVHRLPGVVYLTCSTCNLFSLISFLSFVCVCRRLNQSLKTNLDWKCCMCVSQWRPHQFKSHFYFITWLSILIALKEGFPSWWAWVSSDSLGQDLKNWALDLKVTPSLNFDIYRRNNSFPLVSAHHRLLVKKKNS